MIKPLAILLAVLMAPAAAASAEYRTIVKTDALSEAVLTSDTPFNVLHTYQPGDVVVLSEPGLCSAETCEVILPSGGHGWVANHKITDHSDLAAEQGYYQQVDWDSINKFELRIWADSRDEPAFAHACAIALESGEPLDERSVMSLCPKFRHTREIQEATLLVKDAMEALNQEDRNTLLNGGAPIGAPKAAVLLAWGEPNETKRIVTNGMVAEQMIYDERVAHIENGELIRIEE